MENQNEEIELNELESSKDSNSEKTEAIDNSDIANTVELNPSGDVNGPIQNGNNNITTINNFMTAEKEDRDGLPTQFLKQDVTNEEKHELSDHIAECIELTNEESLSLISCADKSILDVVLNSIAATYEPLGYDVKVLFFEEYDRSTIVKLVEDIDKNVIKWNGKMLLFIWETTVFDSDKLPQSLFKLKNNEAKEEHLKRILARRNCKIIYASLLRPTSQTIVKNHHIDFLDPFLKFNEKFEFKAKICQYQKEGRVPQSEIGLLDCLKSSLNEDDFEVAIENYEVNKKIFHDAVEKGGIYLTVLFVGTFFRGLEFDEFQRFLLLLIRQLEKNKRAEKLIQQWHKKADEILKETGLNNRDEMNYRIIDFNQQDDAQSCKKILLAEKRVLVDRMANIIVSPAFFFYENFRHSTTQKINAFIATFGHAYGRYYKHEVPFRFLDIIEEKTNELIQTQTSLRKIVRSERNYLLRRFSDLLIEIELSDTSGQAVDLILDEAINKQFRYNSIFDVLRKLHYRSEKQVLGWYIKSLKSSVSKESEIAFWEITKLLTLDPASFFSLFDEMASDLPTNTSLDSSSLLEKQLVLIIFLNFHIHLPKSISAFKYETDQETLICFSYHDSIFNSDQEQIEKHFSSVVRLLMSFEFEVIYNELFPLDPYFIDKFPRQIVTQIFFYWSEILSRSGKEEIKSYLMEAIKSNLSTKKVQRDFKRAYKDLRRSYNERIIHAQSIVERKQFKEKRNLFVQFIKQTQ